MAVSPVRVVRAHVARILGSLFSVCIVIQCVLCFNNAVCFIICYTVLMYYMYIMARSSLSPRATCIRSLSLYVARPRDADVPCRARRPVPRPANPHLWLIKTSLKWLVVDLFDLCCLCSVKIVWKPKPWLMHEVYQSEVGISRSDPNGV